MGCFLRHLWVVGLTGAAAAALLTSASGSTDRSDELKSLARQLGASDLRADYILVVDCSTSMNKPLGGAGGQTRFDAVRAAVRAFLEQLDAGEYVSILHFGRYVRPGVTPREMPAEPERRSALLNEVSSWPAPSGDLGNFTDIGAALEATLQELNRPGHSELQIVFFLTDGIHEPPPGSRYASTSGAAWDSLSTLAAKRLEERAVRVFALGLGNATDIRLVRKVFPHAVITEGDYEALKAFFQRNKEEVLRQKVAALVQERLTGAQPSVSAPATVSVTAGGRKKFDLGVRFRPLELEYRWKAAVRGVRSDLPVDVRLLQSEGSGRPGDREVTLRAELQSRYRRSILQALLDLRRTGPQSKVQLDLEFTITPLPASLMRDMDIQAAQYPLSVKLEDVKEIRGPNRLEWALIAFVAAVLLWTLLRIVMWSRCGRLTGRLVYLSGPVNQQPRSFDLAAYGRAAGIRADGTYRTLEMVPQNRGSTPGRESQIIAILRPLRPGLLPCLTGIAPPRAELELEADVASEVKIRKVAGELNHAAGARLIVEPDDEIQIGEWSFTYQPG